MSFELIENAYHEKTKRVINRLFAKLEIIFPKFWVNIKSPEQLEAIKDEWASYFRKVGLSDVNVIKRGIDKCQEINEDYLIKASKFVEYCEPTPENLGIPEPNEAFYFATKSAERFTKYTIPSKNGSIVIEHVLKQIGKDNFRNLPKEKALKIFKSYYELAIRKFMKGELLDPQPQIESAKEFLHEQNLKQRATMDEHKGVKSAAEALKSIKSMLR